ncbi:MAG: DNA/RNA nuclease SfsA [Elusimicrobiota bacterium]|nr:DNA/RNA nuclease SfsA [Elusimicrobiota bacterium]
MKYLFTRPLQKGLITSRPNRFVMFVKSQGKALRCRCPAPTKIGNSNFKAVPCLLSHHKEKGKTSHTVEAISLKNTFGKHWWVGINQTKVNAVCEYFLNSGGLSRLIKKPEFRRDGKIGNSRIDFVSKNILLEVKTPLTVLPNLSSELTNYKHAGKYERTIRHYSVLSKYAKSGKRAIVLLAYLYPAPAFNPFKQNTGNLKFINAMQKAYKNGVEFWQVNMAIDKSGIVLLRYFKL